MAEWSRRERGVRGRRTRYRLAALFGASALQIHLTQRGRLYFRDEKFSAYQDPGRRIESPSNTCAAAHSGKALLALVPLRTGTSTCKFRNVMSTELLICILSGELPLDGSLQALRACCQAATSLRRSCLLSMRRSRHWRGVIRSDGAECNYGNPYAATAKELRLFRCAKTCGLFLVDDVYRRSADARLDRPAHRHQRGQHTCTPFLADARDGVRHAPCV